MTTETFVILVLVIDLALTAYIVWLDNDTRTPEQKRLDKAIKMVNRL